MDTFTNIDSSQCAGSSYPAVEADNEKKSQFVHTLQKNTYSCPYGCCSTPSIPEYLFNNGLLKGTHYDVVIKAFNKKYKLHRLFLDQSPYFKSLFSWSTNTTDAGAKTKGRTLSSNSDSDADSDSDSDSDSETILPYRKVYNLSFDEPEGEEYDSEKGPFLVSQRQKSFELVISRLYGAANLQEEYKIPYNMIEMGQYLAISDIVCTSTDYIIKHMDISNIAENLRFATNADYGSASQRIIENGKGILCSNGWEKGPEAWDGIPTAVIAEIVGEDYFFVPNEWDRCIFIIKLIERRLELKSEVLLDENNDISCLKKVLNEKIYYCHIPPYQLQDLEELCDINGDNYIEPQVLHAALWQTVQLETFVTRSNDSPHLDTIITSPTQPSKNHSWFKVPSKDETLSGLPKELDILLKRSLSTSVNNQLNSHDSKITQGRESISSNDELSTNFVSEDSIDRFFNWTKIPPFRLSLTFANVSELPTDKRVYGKTFWYAGSYWNLYLQKSYIPSKNSYQVGVYLHRAHNGSSNTSSKSGLINPDVFANNVNYRSFPKNYNRNSNKIEPYATSSLGCGHNNSDSVDKLKMEMTDLSLADENKSFFGGLANGDNMNKVSKKKNKKQSIINYEDNRSAIKVYFIIFTPSRRSAPTITSFLSVPNDFSKSQSWGWKSNNMCVFNEDGTFVEGQDPDLKFMILLGNV